MTPFKDDTDRALNWVLSERGFGRIPYEFDSRPPIRLIARYYIQRLAPTYNAHNGTPFYIVTWHDRFNIEQRKRMSIDQIIDWIKKSNGARPPINPTGEGIDYNWLSVPDICRMYGVTENTVRAYLARSQHPPNTVIKVSGNRWRMWRDYAREKWGNAVITRNNGRGAGQPSLINLKIYTPDSDAMLPMRKIADTHNTTYSNVKQYVHYWRDVLLARGLISYYTAPNGRQGVYFSCALARDLWGRK